MNGRDFSPAEGSPDVSTASTSRISPPPPNHHLGRGISPLGGIGRVPITQLGETGLTPRQGGGLVRRPALATSATLEAAETAAIVAEDATAGAKARPGHGPKYGFEFGAKKKKKKSSYFISIFKNIYVPF